MAKLQEAEVKV